MEFDERKKFVFVFVSHPQLYHSFNMDIQYYYDKKKYTLVGKEQPWKQQP